MISEGSIIVAQIPQANGETKARPVLLLRELPGFADFLVCGISTQVRHAIADFDLVIDPSDQDFKMSGLKASSVIRLNFLSTIPQSRMARYLGNISSENLALLQNRLANYIYSSS